MGQFALSEDQLAIQDMARRFTADRITPFAAEWDEKHVFPKDTISAAVGCECQPSFFSGAPKLTPGMSFSIARQEIPFGPSSPVRTIVR